VAYRALHPSLRTPVTLRRYRTDDLLPGDLPLSFSSRARAAAAVTHPNLTALLDAGTFRDEPYAAVETPADAADLDSLVREIGPMPGFLAAEFGRQAAAALRVAHERGLWHGDVRPANLLVAPLAVKAGPDGELKRRPAPNAAAKLAELGLVPTRPPAVQSAPPPEVLAYLPPERIDAAEYTPAGDLYGLGATLYYLLTARPPFAAVDPAELIRQVRIAAPASVASLRPDLPPDFAALVTRLLSKRPEDRPPTAFDVETALVPFCRPGTKPKSASGVMPALVAIPHPDAAPVAESVPEGASASDEWYPDAAFSTAHVEAGPAPRRQLTQKDRGRTRLLIGLGLALHLTAVALGLALILGLFNQSPEPDPQPTPTQKKKDKDRKPKRADPDS
jgi:serine/threonine protein kinase